METITKKIRTIETIQYSAHCSNCGRKIVGTNRDQLIWNMKLHKDGKRCKNEK